MPIRGALAGDFAQVQRLSHTMKGSISNFEAEEVHSALQELERAALDQDPVAARDGVPPLEAALARLVEALGTLEDVPSP